MTRLPLSFTVLLVLAGCVSPSPGFFGARRGDIDLAGINFVVYHDTSRAEVVRMGYLTRDKRHGIVRLMEDAAARVSGCSVVANSIKTKIPGDTGVAQFDLDCARDLAPAR